MPARRRSVRPSGSKRAIIAMRCGRLPASGASLPAMAPPAADQLRARRTSGGA
jgi:hypothetical protein